MLFTRDCRHPLYRRSRFARSPFSSPLSRAAASLRAALLARCLRLPPPPRCVRQSRSFLSLSLPRLCAISALLSLPSSRRLPVPLRLAAARALRRLLRY